jgi:predicted nucleotidyltransferase
MTTQPPSEQSRWRVELGRRVGAAYLRDPGVAAVLIAGSASRGEADRDSDVELMVAWAEPPTEAQRRLIVEPLAADHRLLDYDDDWECWQEDLFIGRSAEDAPSSGVLIEVVGQLVPVIGRRLDDVVERFEPNLDKQSTIHALLNGIPLHGEELIGSWRTKAEPYPRGLTLAMVNRYAQIDYFADWERFLARGQNLLLIHERFTQIERQLLLVLQALNGVYHYKFKWLERVVGELAVAPRELGERLRTVLTSDVPTGAEALTQLVEEVYDLVEERLPEVDVVRLRSIFRWRRQPWDAPPPEALPAG